jgi:cytochrome b
MSLESRMNHRPDPIWDLPVRLFHWSLPLLVCAAWICAEFDWMQAHAWCGYTLLVLTAWRIAWGFAGSTHARFGAFLRSPRAAWRHLRGAGTPVEGHNPAGGWSVLAMLALLLLQPLTGMFNEDDISFSGPLAHLGGGRYTDAAGAWHEWNFYLLMLLVGVHVTSVLLYQRKGANLIRPMIDGGRAREPVVTRPAWLALMILVVLAAGLWFALSQVPRPQVFL